MPQRILNEVRSIIVEREYKKKFPKKSSGTLRNTIKEILIINQDLQKQIPKA